jgi:hypothetical protein
MPALPLVPAPEGSGREVLEFDCGVLAYAPVREGGYWRLRWVEAGRRKDTTARSKEQAVTKAYELVERLSQGHPDRVSWGSGDANSPTVPPLLMTQLDTPGHNEGRKASDLTSSPKGPDSEVRRAPPSLSLTA